MLAPFFAKGEDGKAQHYILPEKAILPFSFWERLGRQGAYGEVFKARIHHQHHALCDTEQGGDLWVAIKRLNTTNKQEFTREMEILKQLGHPRHKHRHLMTLLFSYEQHSRFHLVLSWAGADLLGYWENVRPEPVANRQTSLWLAEQCHGLAEGLLKIHQCVTFDKTDSTVYSAGSLVAADDCMASGSAAPSDSLRSRSRPASVDSSRSGRLYGRHGDIKPENILWYPSPGGEHGQGVLKISDFGLTECMGEDAGSRRAGGWVPNSPSYRPPELDLEDGKISSFCDVWALGCLYLEFVIWLLGGWRAVHDFGESRRLFDKKYGMRTDTFFVIHKTDDPSQARASVKPTVVEFSRQLHRHRRCTNHLRHFLGLIMKSMVVINTHSQPKSSENGEQAKSEFYRRNCRELSRELSGLYEECRKRDDYTSQSEGRNSME